jgi:hypothetical protein
MPTALKPMPAAPDQLRAAPTPGRPVRVDQEAGVIFGYTLAMEGRFKDDRGEFDRAALAEVVRLANADPKGLRSRFSHPSESSDGLGKHLGRLRPGSAYLDKSGPAWLARADLRISPSSRDTPSGDLGGYVLRLAAEDPDALSSSLVLKADKRDQLDAQGRLRLDPDGEPVPPLWWPTALRATDVVDTGAAVDGLLSAQNLCLDDLPDALQRRGWEMLDKLFAGQPADVIRSRVDAYLGRYLSARGVAEPAPATSAEEKSVQVVPATVAEKPAAAARPRTNTDRALTVLARIRGMVR